MVSPEAKSLPRHSEIVDMLSWFYFFSSFDPPPTALLAPAPALEAAPVNCPAAPEAALLTPLPAWAADFEAVSPPSFAALPTPLPACAADLETVSAPSFA